ncbi:uncharacterized protein [Nicotiana tomentosiformis]|uniref:uncharacterized protein n=1 Tax=Nicotiana tomentosiformis TaxID=4098 RepID=UPI00388C4CB1
MKPQVLAALILGKPSILYIVAQERSIGALLAQENSEGKEKSLYYLNRMMTPNELNYSPIEKMCLALVFSIQKLKLYFQAHVVRLVSKENLIKFEISKPVLSDRLTRWYLQFQQFKIVGAGTGVVFVTSQGEVLSYSFTLTQLCSNNVAEYQAVILGLEMVVNMNQEEWRQPIIDYLSYGILQENPRRRTGIRRRAPHFLYYKDTLYKSFEGVLLRCLREDEALQAFPEAHSGPLQKSSGGHLYILATTDYFLKLAEDVALKEEKKENVAGFIRVNIIYRFGIPRYIITDNGKPFDNRLMNKICDLFSFKQHNSLMYDVPPMV